MKDWWALVSSVINQCPLLRDACRPSNFVTLFREALSLVFLNQIDISFTFVVHFMSDMISKLIYSKRWWIYINIQSFWRSQFVRIISVFVFRNTLNLSQLLNLKSAPWLFKTLRTKYWLIFWSVLCFSKTISYYYDHYSFAKMEANLTIKSVNLECMFHFQGHDKLTLDLKYFSVFAPPRNVVNLDLRLTRCLDVKYRCWLFCNCSGIDWLSKN